MLQYSHIRRMHAVKDKTMLLVDSPNTLVLFSRQEDGF